MRKVLCRPILLWSKIGLRGFYSHYVLPCEFYFPVKYTGNLSLAGYKTPPSVVPHLLHAAAVEFVNGKDVLTPPVEQQDRGRKQLPAVMRDDLLLNQFRQ